MANALLTYVYDDGGRREAGFRGRTGDCVTRAIAIGTGKPYREVYDALYAKAGKTPRLGVRREIYEDYLLDLGWTWTPTMKVGQGCRVHLRRDELPGGIIICRLSRHLACVVDHTLRDTHDCSRAGTRCVYGYYSAPGGTGNGT